MIKTINKALVLLFISLAMASTIRAQSLEVGAELNRYPKVDWLRGEAIDKLDPNKTYIIECWATWCGPCKAAIPHMNDLYRKYGDRIVFVGQNIWEKDKSTVDKFVESQGDNMAYPIAFGGGKDSEFSLKWMKEAGVNGIPATFVIQNNKLVWLTNPMNITEDILELLLNKSFTIEKAKALDPRNKYEAVRKMIFEEKNYDQAEVELDKLIKQYPMEENGRTLRAILLQKSGRDEEALTALKADYAELGTSMLQYFVIKILTDASRWQDLYDFSVMDYNRKDIPAAIRFEAFLASIQSGMILGKVKESEKRLSSFIENATDATELMRTQYILSQKAGIEVTDTFKKQILIAAKKSLALNPINYYVIKGLLTNQLDYINRAEMQQILVGNFEELTPEQKTSSYGIVVSECITMLKNGEVPDADNFKVWDKLMK